LLSRHEGIEDEKKEREKEEASKAEIEKGDDDQKSIFTKFESCFVTIN